MNSTHSPSETEIPSEEETEAKTTHSYSEAGVDIDLAHQLLDDVKGDISRATRPEVMGSVGGFGGLFNIQFGQYKNPVLVSSIDGVGTKLMVAGKMNKYDGVGFDIVNHCINDIAVQGAEPLYFLDYLGIGKLRSPLYEEVLKSVAKACSRQNVALLGGETAEMPGMYGQDFDLVGCITGVVDRDKIITGRTVTEKDNIIGLASSGLHTNGYSLARQVLLEQGNLDLESRPKELDESVGESLLKPHLCYWPAIKEILRREIPVHGMAHITGGGWVNNIKRILPESVTARCFTKRLPVPAIMKLIQKMGEIDRTEMHRAFNMGLGLACIVPPDASDTVLEICNQAGFEAALIGRIEKRAESSCPTEQRVILE